MMAQRKEVNTVFPGSFYKEGDYRITFEVTQYIKYYSLKRLADYDIQTNDDGIS